MALTLALSGLAAPPTPVSFREEIEPILKADCTGCHGKDSASGKLRLDSPEALFAGGEKFGKKLVLPGNPKASALIGYLRGTHKSQMPLGMPPLKEAQIQKFEAWIAQGAKIDAPTLGFPYVGPKNPSVPTPKNPVLSEEWAINSVDKFVLAGLESKGLTPSPPASKIALLRRVFADLIGMPPTPAEADAFLSDKSPDAYEKLVDRLLADSRYGERWARHWLDLVRYAETEGFEADGARPRAWRYRDYVIRALNADKPYDRFLKEQLAGDELYPTDAEARVATGFFRLGTWDGLSRDDAGRWQDTLNDTTDTVGAAFLGLTIGCARCHDHKYDKITARDYYRLQAFFTNTRFTETRLPGELDPPAQIARREALQARLREKQTALDAVRAEKGDPEEADRKRRRETLEDETNGLSRELTPIDRVADSIAEPGTNAPTHHVLLRGSLGTPGEAVKPGFVASLCGGKEVDPALTPTSNTSGARTALASWIASPENPLTARVIVNRLWQHHFGAGIVETPSDFGRNGGKPSNPALLDWLASELPRRGWSLKSVHRLILTSAAYKQSVAVRPECAKLDPQNRLLWRQNRQRLEGEAIRDSILTVSGRLNPEAGGPSVYPAISDEVLSTGSTHKWGRSPEDQQRRRTIYVFQRRSLALPLTEVFDGPDMVNTCPRRQTTTIAPQALALFNGAFGREESVYFATRVVREAGAKPEAQIERAWRLALVRRPTPVEREKSLTFLTKKAALHRVEKNADPERAALANLCHVLFNTNEFLYAD